MHNDTYSAIASTTQSDLSGKYVFITGASRGIGRALALSYTKAGAATIGISARSDLSSLKQEIAEVATTAGRKTPKILALTLDIKERQSVESAAKTVAEKFGRLDILINNAAYLEPHVLIADSDPDEWWKPWDVNIRGTYLVTRSFLPLMLKAGNKQIINLSTVGAHLMFPGGSGHRTTKFALLRFTEYINVDYGDKGVVAYSVHPGAIPTEMSLRLPEELHPGMLDLK